MKWFLFCLTLAGLSFAQIDTAPDFTDYTNSQGGTERPANEYQKKIRNHWIDRGSKVYCCVYVVHNNSSVDTIIRSKCIYKKTIKSDSLYTTNLRNAYFSFGEVIDSANGHR
jgi:hypothetical protein